MNSDVRQTPASAARPRFSPHMMRFLKRTAVMTIVTLLLVALNASVYFDRAWAGWYLLSGLWALVFFGLLPFILKALFFDRNSLVAIGLCMAKLGWIVVMIVALSLGAPAERTAGWGSALLAGLNTPLLVAALRGAGMAMMNLRTEPGAASPTAVGTKP